MRLSNGIRLSVAAPAVAAALLALVSLQLLRTPVDISPVAPSAGKVDAPPPGSVEPATTLDKRTADAFRETVSRTLFNPSRRPVERKESAEDGPGVAVSDLRLVGVMKSADRPPRALLRSPNEPTGKWITEGAELNGWKLHKVGERSVVLKSGARSHELKLAPPRRPSQ